MPPTSASGTYVVIVAEHPRRLPVVLGPYSDLGQATDELYRQERQMRKRGLSESQWVVWVAEVMTPDA